MRPRTGLLLAGVLAVIAWPMLLINLWAGDFLMAANNLLLFFAAYHAHRAWKRVREASTWQKR